MASPPIPQPTSKLHQCCFYCVESPGFYKPLWPHEVNKEFSRIMGACQQSESRFGDVEKILANTVVRIEDCDIPLIIEKDSTFWQSETVFTDPDVLVQFACGLSKTLCDHRVTHCTVVFMPYYKPVPIEDRAKTLKYVFGLLLTPVKILSKERNIG